MAYNMEEERREFEELKRMAESQQEQIRLISQGIDLLKRLQPGSRGATVICWRCQQPGHLARDCDGQRVTAGAQPSPAAKSGTHGLFSPHRPDGGLPSGLGSERSRGGLPGPRHGPMSIHPNSTSYYVIVQCVYMCLCVCMLMLNLMGAY